VPRSVYYLASTLTRQLKSGQNYDRMKAVIGIHLLDFELFDGPDQQNQAIWCFELRDRQQPTVKFGDELQLNLIELPKADRLGLTNPAESALAAWITFLEHWQEESTMAAIAYPPVQEALARITRLSADEETQHLALVRERALRDEISEIKAATEKGMQQGEKKILIRLIQKRFGQLPGWAKEKIAQASEEQLEHWADNILDATTLEEVFETGPGEK